VGASCYGVPDSDFEDLDRIDERKVQLNQVALREKARFVYEYDFGDSWEHEILVEKILPVEPGVHYPRCLAGKRAGPPEDVGGVWGYDHFLEVMGDPNHPEHDDLVKWYGGNFDPEAFDVAALNQVLQRFEPLPAPRRKKTAGS